MANTNKKKEQPKKEESKHSLFKYVVICTIILLIAYILYAMFIKKNDVKDQYTVKNVDPMEQYKNIPEPPFKQEGSLTFLDSAGKKEIKKMTIEIADNPAERQQGLMYRRGMDDEKAMLFIFQQEDMQGFWMKNTLIPLDIMFVGKDKRIINIHKNTTPLSEKDLPSTKPALYVVEVRGGFTDQYNIKPGDKIEFSKQ
jgi:uncharacterized membrane protein (UPF0127 family)